MKIVQGKDLSPDVLIKWIERVNAELNRSDKNQACFDFITAVSDRSVFIIDDNFYAVLLPAPNLWGDMELHVISSYVLPEHRSFKKWRFLQSIIEQIAVVFECKNIIQGSHFGDARIYDFWQRDGYEVCGMKKRIN